VCDGIDERFLFSGSSYDACMLLVTPTADFSASANLASVFIALTGIAGTS
jgi:hypothetical protein